MLQEKANERSEMILLDTRCSKLVTKQTEKSMKVRKVLMCALGLSMLYSADYAHAGKKKKSRPVEEYKVKKTGKFKSHNDERTTIAGQDWTTIKITDKVKADGISKIGVNIGGSNASSHATKFRSGFNFEGTTVRSVPIILAVEGNKIIVDGGYNYKISKAAVGVAELLTGTKMKIVSGVHAGETATIKAVKGVFFFRNDWNKKVGAVEFTIDKEFPNLKQMNTPVGVRKGQPGDCIIVENLENGKKGVLRDQEHWMSGVSLKQDTRDGGTGYNSGLFTAPAQMKFYGAVTKYNEGEVSCEFWAKAVDGSSEVQVLFDSQDKAKKVSGKLNISDKTWKKYKIKGDASKLKKYNPQFSVNSGKLLVDDIAFYVGGDKNPTSWRDYYIDFLKELDIGILRKLQMGGSTIENMLRPALECGQYVSQPGTYELALTGLLKGGKGPTAYGMYEFLELSEYMNITPWYNIPGVLQPEELEFLMEYLGGPAGTKGGDLRISQGHPKPWTDTIRQINIEYGNEPWNKFGPYFWGGFSGPDYWTSLTQRAKASKHYKKNIIFHAGSQNWSNGMAKKIAKNHPSMDRLTVAPYICHKYEDWQDHLVKTGEQNLFQMLFAHSTDTIVNKMAKVNDELVKANYGGMSVYEFNYHLTHGNGALYNRYKYTQSLGGALAIANSTLYMLEEFRAKEQCLFTLGGGPERQDFYNYNKNWPSWGISFYDAKADKLTMKPIALALKLMNKAIFDTGSALKTTMEGEIPTYEGIGVFSAIKTNLKGNGELAKMTDIPSLWSYAFKKDNKRSVAIINMDIEKDRKVAIDFAGSAKNVESWILTADNIAATAYNNSPETLALANEFKCSTEMFKNNPDLASKYTSKGHQLAFDIFKDAFNNPGDDKFLKSHFIPDAFDVWVKYSAKSIKTKDEFFVEFEKYLKNGREQKEASRALTIVSKSFLPFLQENSKEYKPLRSLVKVDMKNFKTGTKITVPKHSMQVIRWEEN